MPRPSLSQWIYDDDDNNNNLLLLLLMKCNNYEAANYVIGSVPRYIILFSFKYSRQPYFFNAYFNFMFLHRAL
jgi:hypothetical protein